MPQLRFAELEITSMSKFLVVVSAVTVNLAPDLSARPSRAVDIDVSGSGANGFDQFIKFSSANSSLVCQVGDISRSDRPRYCGWWGRARLSASGTIS